MTLNFGKNQNSEKYQCTWSSPSQKIEINECGIFLSLGLKLYYSKTGKHKEMNILITKS